MTYRRRSLSDSVPAQPGYTRSTCLSDSSLGQGIGSLLKPCDEGSEIHIHRPADLQQLDCIQPAHAPLHVAYEDLGPPNGLGKVGLGQPGSLPRTP